MKQFILLIVLILISSKSFSSMDFDIQDDVQNDSLYINGDFQAPKRKSPADYARDRRRKLEAHNEAMALKKIEQMRLRKEVELNKKLHQQFNEQLKMIDQIQ